MIKNWKGTSIKDKHKKTQNRGKTLKMSSPEIIKCQIEKLFNKRRVGTVSCLFHFFLKTKQLVKLQLQHSHSKFSIILNFLTISAHADTIYKSIYYHNLNAKICLYQLSTKTKKTVDF